MPQEKSTLIQYSHTEPLPLEPRQKQIRIGLFVAAVVMSLLFLPIGLFLMLVAIIYAMVAGPKRYLLLTPRYLLCGTQVAYYANIRRLDYAPERGHICLYWDGQSLFIEQDRFPTGARKPDKVAKNKQAKFSRVALKLVDKVLQHAPQAELHGVDRDAWLRERPHGGPAPEAGA